MTDNSSDAIDHLTLRDALTYCGPERWDHLVASSRAPSPFMSWAWHRAWVESALQGDVNASFALVLAGPSRCVQGVLPLTIRPMRFRRARVSTLTWATQGVGCPDHLDFPANPDTDLRIAVSFLETMPWDVMVLPGVAEDATNVTLLVNAFTERGYTARRARLDSCPYLDLPDSWDDYLMRFRPARRQQIRRKERKLIREHAMSITDYAGDRLDEGWCRLRSLHEERWAGAGTLGSPRLNRLLREFSSALAARGELWLTTLDLRGEPAAAWYGFGWLDTVYFYQAGRDPKWASLGVGSVLMGAMIRRAIERGYRRFDFLRGQEQCKLAMTSTARPIYELVVFRPGWRSAWLRGLDLAARMRARLRSQPEYASQES